MRRRTDLPRNRRTRPPSIPTTADPNVSASSPSTKSRTGRPNGRKRNKPKLSDERREQLRRRRLENLKAVAGVAFVVITALALAWGIRQQVTSNTRFAIKSVRVKGAVHRTPEQITKEAGVKVGDNIFKVDLRAVQRRILLDPWIVDAKVLRDLPSRITLDIEEREAAAVVVIGRLPYLATFDGEVFKQVEPGDPSDLAVITGISHEQVAHSKRDVQRKIKQAITLSELWRRFGAAKRYPAQEVHVGELGELTLYVGNDAIRLQMGNAPYRKKVLRAARVLREVRRRRGKAAIVFMDNQAHPERVVVRMR